MTNTDGCLSITPSILIYTTEFSARECVALESSVELFFHVRVYVYLIPFHLEPKCFQGLYNIPRFLS